jgi:MFS transporter, MHS family, citrate/tricarballylate:H+ symporter
VALSIMAMGTILIAFVPSYATIGALAPFLVLIGRLLQGFSAGVELGGVSVYLSEMATPGHKGFYVAWQSGSQQVAIIVAAVIGYGLNKYLTPPEISDWFWRVPFFVGCLIVPFIFVIRRSLEETWLPVMGAVSDRIGRRPILLAFTGLTIVTAYPALSCSRTDGHSRPTPRRTSH